MGGRKGRNFKILNLVARENASICNTERRRRVSLGERDDFGSRGVLSSKVWQNIQADN